MCIGQPDSNMKLSTPGIARGSGNRFGESPGEGVTSEVSLAWSRGGRLRVRKIPFPWRDHR